ncbi:hypothetical protein ALC57_00390 [Trachymyrmex cornetzi]|uniref:Uncharacterized protein n=1 Tax=Trachymyrmex cornetzi TaxID=471704 RepID=A0A151JRZ8_9HYME|nr:hypothetical protein ALC57_00390 [Trachymyrmex cornetzi]
MLQQYCSVITAILLQILCCMGLIQQYKNVIENKKSDCMDNKNSKEKDKMQESKRQNIDKMSAIGILTSNRSRPLQKRKLYDSLEKERLEVQILEKELELKENVLQSKQQKLK